MLQETSLSLIRPFQQGRVDPAGLYDAQDQAKLWTGGRFKTALQEKFPSLEALSLHVSGENLQTKEDLNRREIAFLVKNLEDSIPKVREISIRCRITWNGEEKKAFFLIRSSNGTEWRAVYCAVWAGSWIRIRWEDLP